MAKFLFSETIDKVQWKASRKHRDLVNLTDKNIVSAEASIFSEQLGFCTGTVLPGEEGSRLHGH